MSYTPDTLARLQADAAQIIARYPDGHSRSALLPMLHLIQSVDGYVSPNGIDFIAATLDLPRAEISAVATFYTQYKRHPTGDYLVGVCTNALCAVMGGDEIWERSPRRSASAATRPAKTERLRSSASSATRRVTTRPSSWSTGNSSTTRVPSRPWR